MNLSIIIPTYNRIDFLKECLNSILDQKSSIYEVIIVDDNSRDETLSYCEKVKNENTKIKFILSKNEENKGAQYSRNLGLSLSTGSAIMFLDSDDTLYQNNLSVFLNALTEAPELDYVYGQVLKTNAVLAPLNNHDPVGYEWDDKSLGLAGYHWHTMGAIYRKTYLQKIGNWDDELKGSQDWEFQARVKVNGGSGKFIPTIIGLWRDHEEDRIGTKKFRHQYVQSVILACKKIAYKAKVHNQFDTKLAEKLARRILFHAVEFSVNGFRKERNTALDEASNLLKNNKTPLYYFLKSMKKLPPSTDYLLWQLIKK